MTKIFKHSLAVEERFFSLDIVALKKHDSGFKNAYENGNEYQLDIKLSQLFIICPRKTQRKQQYKRLQNFLQAKNITLNISSRKKEMKNN